MGILLVTEAFDLDGENLQRGESLTAEQFQKLREPKNYGNINKVTEISSEGAGRLGMRDATPNKPVHANVHPNEATVGHAGSNFSMLSRDLFDEDGNRKAHALDDVQNALTAPIAENEGDTRKSHRDTLMGEHADDKNFILASGPTPDERADGLLGTRHPSEAGETKYVERKSVPVQSAPTVLIADGAIQPDMTVAIVDAPKGGDGGVANDDRANAREEAMGAGPA